MTGIAMPEVLEERLPNGATMLLARRSGVPLVAARLLVRAGSALDPAGRAGLAHLVAAVARRGAGGRDGDALDRAVEALGADLGAAAEEDGTIYGLTAPSEALPRLLDLLLDVAASPALASTEVSRLRRREIAELAHDADEPSTVADRGVLRAAYAGHPYGHPVQGTTDSLPRLGRGDAVAFHRRWYGPGQATLVVVGPLALEETARLVRARLARWTGGAEAAPESPARGPLPRRVVVVDRRDATQAQIRLAANGIARRDPSYFAAVVGNTVLGGGFTSRLVEAIRVNRGLSYGVRSRFATGRAAGLFLLSSFTRVETAGELVRVALEEMRRFRDGGPTQEELDRARNQLSGLFPLSLETHDQWAERICDARILGYPFEEVATYRERIQGVTREEARDACRGRLPIEDGVVLAVGPARALVPQLEEFGPAEVLPVRRVV